MRTGVQRKYVSRADRRPAREKEKKFFLLDYITGVQRKYYVSRAGGHSARE